MRNPNNDRMRDRSSYDRDSYGNRGAGRDAGWKGPMLGGHWTESRDWRRGRRDRVSDVMTGDVVAVHPDDSVVFAARLMGDEDVGALPVVDRFGRPLGVVTDRDITCRLVARGGDVRRARVGDCMTDEVFACAADSSLEDCMRTMSHHQVRRLLVVDERDRLVGVVSQSDLARAAEQRAGTGARKAVADVVAAVSEPSDSPYH